MHWNMVFRTFQKAWHCLWNSNKPCLASDWVLNMWVREFLAATVRQHEWQCNCSWRKALPPPPPPPALPRHYLRGQTWLVGMLARKVYCTMQNLCTPTNLLKASFAVTNNESAENCKAVPFNKCAWMYHVVFLYQYLAWWSVMHGMSFVVLRRVIVIYCTSCPVLLGRVDAGSSMSW